MKIYESPVVTVQNVESSDIITQSIFADTATTYARVEW